jgi:dsRNA-specific ribonuclease
LIDQLTKKESPNIQEIESTVLYLTQKADVLEWVFTHVTLVRKSAEALFALWFLGAVTFFVSGLKNRDTRTNRTKHPKTRTEKKKN